MSAEAAQGGRHPEAEKVWLWRFTIAVELGLSRTQASEFADGDGDTHDLARLIARGCSPRLAAKIMRS